jgi:hypothetical protein
MTLADVPALKWLPIPTSFKRRPRRCRPTPAPVMPSCLSATLISFNIGKSTIKICDAVAKPLLNSKFKIQNPTFAAPSRISQARTAAFVRGFFTFLELRQILAAVLYGGQDGFEHELSDVDFVVDRQSFRRLPAIIDEYCTQSGWQLCQILRHETTAAYYVCSAADDPSCAVALDACSDYQRNGTIFLAPEELLEDRQRYVWGGYGLSLTNELLYRFSKAAAKNKDTSAAAVEFARYPEVVRRDCAAWLDQNWGASPGSWNAADLSPSLTKLRAGSNHRPSLLQAGALSRILSRILQPTGLVVITGQQDFDATAARLEGVFGHLYFRRFRKSHRWHPAMLRDLVASTMIVVPEMGRFWTRFIPTDCIHRINSGEDCQSIAKHLHQRCKRRESRNIL